jgi:flagellin FlaB
MSLTSDSKKKARFQRLILEQSGITGLETAIVLIAFVVVAAVFAFTVLTTGLFTSEKAKETTMAGVASASSTLSVKGSVTAIGGPVIGTNNTCLPGDCEFVDHIRVHLATTGVDEATFQASNIMLTYQDSINVELMSFFDPSGPGAPNYINPNNADADIRTCRSGVGLGGLPPLGGGGPKSWCIKWGSSSGANPDEIIKPGEILELYIFLNNLPNASLLGTKQQFNIEVILQGGSVIRLDRTTPAAIQGIMNLN